MSVRLGLILLIALISVSTSSLVVRHVATVPALVLAFWRMLIASGILWGFSFVNTSETLTPINKKRIIIAGILLGCHFACFFLGVRNTSIANATLFGCMAPIFTVLISMIQKNKVSQMTYVGLFLALFGATIVQFDYFSLDSSNLFGNLISLLGSLFIAMTFIIAKEIRKNTNSIVYGRTLFLVASITLFLITSITGDSILNFNTSHVPWFIFLGLVPSILGHNLLNHAVKYIGPTAVSSVPLGEPVLASIFALLLFGESIPVGAVWGGPIILMGVYIIIKK
ncbi:MAG: EamA family transporter [Candidatus Marinimicrobia bacterium]|nr:EamA family transporter [Candidatus Neomarinimicrobiota bacterium]MBT7822832.1 EamA family transporter [Candidatus Neomarinimicrobiota bacterium]